MAERIDGKAIAQKVRTELGDRVRRFRAEHGRAPGLTVVLVGEDPASVVYVRNKERAAQEIGLFGQVLRLPADTSEEALLDLVRELNQTPEVDGILVQFPVPPPIRQSSVLAVLDPKKDVDGLTPVNVGALWLGEPGLVSCTPRGCLRLLQEIGVALSGARAVVVGRSNLVGKPVAALLLAQNATVTLAHSRTKDLPGVCRTAEVLVAAVGKPRLITRDFVGPGAVVIDVGVNRLPDGKLAGDVDYASVEPVARAITPVPGGVGPMTIAMLLENTLIAAEKSASA